MEYSVADNKVNFLIGKNGSGKTTLLDIFLGLIHTKQATRSYDIGNDYIYINQMIPLLGSLECREIVQLVLGLKYEKSSLTIHDLEADVDEFTIKIIKEFWDIKYNHLSGGQKKLFQQVLFIQFDKSVYLLDEPTNFLDRENVHELFRVINAKKNKTFIIVTHDYRDLEIVDDYYVTIIDKGSIKGRFDKEEFETPETSSQFLKYFKG
ncbi:ATP-binding cassette domain-containing protein [Alkalibacterium iburiense]|uniref:ATP-binding cassette domain-containing protein n=1 Tax=Alkalibacterium iburiense TaxID=290589 RepID=A0ABP3HEK3_9LACT